MDSSLGRNTFFLCSSLMLSHSFLLSFGRFVFVVPAHPSFQRRCSNAPICLLLDGLRFDSLVQRPAKMLRPLPVSRKDFMLESTRGQPRETFLNVGEPGVKFP